jgi:hypothetical protein
MAVTNFDWSMEIKKYRNAPVNVLLYFCSAEEKIAGWRYL